jgi:hypothetical protein
MVVVVDRSMVEGVISGSRASGPLNAALTTSQITGTMTAAIITTATILLGRSRRGDDGTVTGCRLMRPWLELTGAAEQSVTRSESRHGCPESVTRRAHRR